MANEKVQRWSVYPFDENSTAQTTDGRWVKYSDHVALVGELLGALRQGQTIVANAVTGALLKPSELHAFLKRAEELLKELK